MIAQPQLVESTSTFDDGEELRVSPQSRLPFRSNSMNVEEFSIWDTFESPPLSVFEIVDIQAAEEEFASGKSEIYETPQELIAALHAAREQYRRSAGG